MYRFPIKDIVKELTRRIKDICPCPTTIFPTILNYSGCFWPTYLLRWMVDLSGCLDCAPKRLWKYILRKRSFVIIACHCLQTARKLNRSKGLSTCKKRHSSTSRGTFSTILLLVLTVRGHTRSMIDIIRVHMLWPEKERM